MPELICVPRYQRYMILECGHILAITEVFGVAARRGWGCTQCWRWCRVVYQSWA